MTAIEHIQLYWRAYLLNALFIALLLTTHTLAYGDSVAGDVGSGTLRLHGTEGGGGARLKSTDVDVQVNGMLARVVVRQAFENTASDWAEGEYVFPLPENSAVDYMAMTIGERHIVGRIRERQAARAAYAQARKAGKKASLISQQRPNLFTSRVANIAPGETIEIELHYLQDIEYDQGRFSLRVPTTLTPRYIPGRILQRAASPDDGMVDYSAGSGWARPTDQVPDAHNITPPMVPASQAAPLRLRAEINAGIPLAKLRSVHHPARIETRNGSSVVELDRGAKLDRDTVLEWEPAGGAAPMAAALSEKLGEHHYLFLMLLPPQLVATGSILPRETIFIVDTSGSMAGNSIAQAKSALLEALAQLKPSDRFNLVEFNSHTHALWSGTRTADPANLNEAALFVERLQANGGTEMRPALDLALSTEERSGYVQQVVFVTDGSVGNEGELFELIRRKAGGKRLFTMGIGSAPNSHFMREAALAGRGSFTYIGSQEQVERAMLDLFHKLQNPLITDLQVDFQGAEVDFFPRALPDLYAGEPLTMAVRVTGPPPVQITLSGQQQGRTFSRQVLVPPRATGKDLSKLWARRHLQELESEARRSGNTQNADIKTRITQLALQHQLMSRFTSFVAIEENPIRPAGAPLRHRAVPNAMPAGNTMAIPVPAGALGVGQMWLIAALALAGILGLQIPLRKKVCSHA
ncbi:marine proteobacterial sortase target protein [Gilvimarinus sp. F26214L]|uniref:marine proteobacterial sortase target protein n=1 Tax=Gilvimarinus sp. DZF01 TaxID=3461371 RepID=UPI0040452365